MNYYHGYRLIIFLLFIQAGQYAFSQTVKSGVRSNNLIAVPERILLNGEYAFAADYADAGEKYEWFSARYNDDIWDRVEVPHVWSLDSRYPYYEGTAWYRKTFSVTRELINKHVRLVFEAVYLRSTIWLNGKQIAVHNGGYTPFEVDVTPYLDFDKPNLLVVKVNNNITRNPNSTPQLVRAWMEDGGIIRDVYLVAHAKVYVTNQKINAVPNLQTGEATIHITSWIRNTKKEPAVVDLDLKISKEDQLLSIVTPKVRGTISPNSVKRFEAVVKLPKDMVQWWQLDFPVLYNLQTSIKGGETAEPVSFGIRSFQVRGTQFLLNGYPIRLSGANRVANGTTFGQNDPVEHVEKDLRMMKEAGLEFMRMHHVPLSKAVLDWADRNGLLLIEECAAPTNLFSDSANALDRVSMREMIERDWNRPSIVAWSIGNEYESETPEGIKWSREMKQFVLSMDSTRLICFASNRAARPNLKPEEEASGLMDFVCLNTYGATPDENAANIDRAHQRWSDKPFIITEYGYRADRVGQEKDRALWFEEMFKIFRERPFISGASVWSFNDYRSRYVSTNQDGYRWWGLVDADRNPRESYSTFKSGLAPFVIKEARMQDGNVVVKLSMRNDFPVRTPTSYTITIEAFNFRGRRVDFQTQQTKLLEPGEEVTLRFPVKSEVSYFRGELRTGHFLLHSFGPTTWSAR